jgi:hypothetical protein
MALVSIDRGLFYPPFEHPLGGSVGVVDLAGEKYAMIGHLYFAGRAAGAKTLSTGAIRWRTATCVWAAAAGATTMDVGIQGVAATGPIARPDGVYQVKRTLASPSGVTTGAWNSTVMNTGSMSLTHGDLIAVVWDMLTRSGSDSVQITGQLPPYVSNLQSQFPTTNVFLAGAWATTGTTGNPQRWPNVVLAMDDGTLGTIAPTCPFSAVSVEVYSSGTNPDERGLIFQVPFNCTIDGLWSFIGTTDANADFNLKLYSSPLSATPTPLATVSQTAEQMSAFSATSIVHKPIAPVSLTKDTDYIVTVEATGIGTVRQEIITLGDPLHKAFYPGGMNMRKGTRQNATGAFAQETITLLRMGVMISHIDTGEEGGGGGADRYGMVGA